MTMIDKNLASDLEGELKKDFPHVQPPLQVRMPRTEPEARVSKSLTEQWHMLRRIDSELRDRIRRERGEILADHDRRWVELQNEFAKELSEAKAAIEKAYAEKLRLLKDETAQKMRENDILQGNLGG